MNFKSDLDRIKLPKKYVRNGKDCFLDSYRQRLIKITSEEIVRQKVLKYFEEVLEVPYDMLLVEVPMSYYEEQVSGRADIIIHEPVDEYTMSPLAIIECKKPEVYLTDSVAEQAMNYRDIVGADYIIITNGIEIQIAKYEYKTDKYLWLESLLSYKEMLNGDGVTCESDEQPFRTLSLEQLQDEIELENFNTNNFHWVYGQDSDIELKRIAVNLYQCFMDSTTTLCPDSKCRFSLLEDLGIRYMDYTNAGGGHYHGYYRSFLVNDISGEPQIVSLSLFGTTPNFNGENRNSYTSLVVAIDNGKFSHNVLQYNLDRYTSKKENSYYFLHDGRISSKKSSALKEYIRDKRSKLLVGNDINLGKLTDGVLFSLDHKDVANLTCNLIEYALLRELFRSSSV